MVKLAPVHRLFAEFSPLGGDTLSSFRRSPARVLRSRPAQRFGYEPPPSAAGSNLANPFLWRLQARVRRSRSDVAVLLRKRAVARSKSRVGSPVPPDRRHERNFGGLQS